MGMPKFAAAFTVYAGGECIPKGLAFQMLWRAYYGCLHADKEHFWSQTFWIESFSRIFWYIFPEYWQYVTCCVSSDKRTRNTCLLNHKKLYTYSFYLWSTVALLANVNTLLQQVYAVSYSGISIKHFPCQFNCRLFGFQAWHVMQFLTIDSLINLPFLALC